VSRFPIVECTNTLLPTLEGWEQRSILAAHITGPKGALRVYSTHLQASRVIDGKSVSGGPQRVQQVAAILKLVATATVPIIVMGDFNAGPGTPEMAPLFATLTDAWTARGTGPGLTSPASPVREAANRIDYIFVSRDVEVRSVSVPVDARTRSASDHYPVVARVAVPTRVSSRLK
jgi:endonuclease/exonuclease/phosphatase family metal-dependent hydrolase